MRPYAYYQREVDWLIARHLSEQEQLVRGHARQIERLETFTKELVATAEALRRSVGDVASQTADDASRAEAGLEETRVALGALRGELNALPYVADAPFESFDTPVGMVTGYRSLDLTAEPSRYAAFESLFRGPAERVTEAQQPYLKLVTDHQPVLDVGCGRGEFLSLLRSQGIDAQGVDSDPGMVEHCQRQQLPVTLASANDYLASLDDASLGTIFCAQVIEHLPVDVLNGFLELSSRKLKSGGILIAETVNPHRIPSLKTFWVDLTHQHPIFPEVALALCAIAGFGEAYVFAPGYDGYEQARFESPSYAVVATMTAPGRD